MRVFADSFYFIAFLDASDEHHAAAVEFHRRRKPRLVTTRWVLAEVADALSASTIRPRVAEFITQLQAQPAATVRVETDDLFAAGLALYAERPDKQWSLTDCISFVVMEQGGLRDALTRDRHFEQAGFVALFAS